MEPKIFHSLGNRCSTRAEVKGIYFEVYECILGRQNQVICEGFKVSKRICTEF